MFPYSMLLTFPLINERRMTQNASMSSPRRSSWSSQIQWYAISHSSFHIGQVKMYLKWSFLVLFLLFHSTLTCFSGTITRCRFHLHLTSRFLVWKCYSQFFCILVQAVFYSERKLVKQAAHQMSVKLTILLSLVPVPILIPTRMPIPIRTPTPIPDAEEG